MLVFVELVLYYIMEMTMALRISFTAKLSVVFYCLEGGKEVNLVLCLMLMMNQSLLLS